MNPDYRGTTQLNAALRNRFGIQQYWDYDPVIERKLVPYSHLMSMAQQIRASEAITTPLSTNMLIDFVAQAQSPLGWNFATTVFAAKFSADERAVVMNILDLNATKLKQQILKLAPAKALKDDAEEWDSDKYDLTIKGTPDNPNPHNYPGWSVDMGVYGVDWEIEVTESEDDDD
jgi:MoxR-like ATPase